MLPSFVVPILGVPVSSYGVVRTVYLLIALALTTRLNVRQGIGPATTLTAFALIVPVALLGARILDSIEYWGRYRSLGDLFGGPGSSIYGAFFAALAAAWLFTRAAGVSALRFLDAGAPAMALGEAMTRVGCFLNGCCYGVPWQGPFAVTFPPSSFAYADQLRAGVIAAGAPHTTPVHPVQLYSVALMLILTGALLRLFRRPHPPGAVLWSFLIGYGCWRLAMAPFRVEALHSATAFSVAFIVVGAYGLATAYRAGVVQRAGLARP